VSGYRLGFENFEDGGKMEALFSDVGADATMFRIVCKSNLTRSLAEDLCEHFVEVLNALDSLKDGYQSLHSLKEEIEKDALETALFEGVSMETATNTILAAGKWLKKTRENNKEKPLPKPRRRRSVSHTVC
jgi:hypothetical protein